MIPTEKDGVKGPGAADGGHRRPQLPDLPQVQEIGPDQDAHGAGDIGAGSPELRRAQEVSPQGRHQGGRQTRHPDAHASHRAGQAVHHHGHHHQQDRQAEAKISER